MKYFIFLMLVIFSSNKAVADSGGMLYILGKFASELNNVTQENTRKYSNQNTSADESRKQKSYSKQECDEHFNDKIHPAFTKPSNNDGVEICFSEFTVLYSAKNRTSFWSAEHLTIEDVIKAKKLKRVDAFHPNPKLKMHERAELADYYKAYKPDLSGFDRGHLSPNRDMPTLEAQYESFDLVNIIPQNSNNNQILWEGIESATRSLVYSSGELYIVTGPIYERGTYNKLNNRVLIPSGMFKAIYDPKKREAAAYVTANAPGMDYEIVSISSLEEKIGLNVFPFLDDYAKKHKMQLGKPTPHRH